MVKAFTLHPIRRKTSPLKTPEFGCLKDTPAINITRGCGHGCVYCYARGFRDAPPKGQIYLYTNLPELLEIELERKRTKPSWVSFSTASDAFQPIEEVLSTTYRTMNILLQHGIGVSFLTKGVIPDEFITLFSKHPCLVKARIGIVCPSEEYRELFEPFTASFYSRLENIKKLKKASVDVTVRIDPVIPGFCTPEQIRCVFQELSRLQISTVSISALIMRPSIVRQFLQELPSQVAYRLLRHYRGQPVRKIITSARTVLLPLSLRRSIYRNIRSIAREYGISCNICGCKNPDLTDELCHPWVETGPAAQQDLFEKPRSVVSGKNTGDINFERF